MEAKTLVQMLLEVFLFSRTTDTRDESDACLKKESREKQGRRVREERNTEQQGWSELEKREREREKQVQ